MEFSVFSVPGLMLCACFFFAGILDAVCGGGGLLTLPAFLATGFPVHLISGTNQCGAFPGCIASAIRYIKTGKVYWPTAILAGILSIFGAFLGAKLNLFISEEYLEIIMIILIPIAAVVMLMRRTDGETRVDTLSKRRLFVTAVGIGIVLGAYQGFYGAGGGTFYLLAFAMLNRLDLVTASGNARVCAVFAGAAAAFTYALSGAVLWDVALAAALFHIVGSYLGAGLALKKGAAVIRPMFLIVLALLLVRIVSAVIL